MSPEELNDVLRVAVVARSERQRRYFAEILSPYGVEIVTDDTLWDCRPDQLDRNVADVLLVDLEEADSDGDLDVDIWIDRAQLPMLFNDGDAGKRHAPKSIAGQAWGRRLADKLGALAHAEPAEIKPKTETAGLTLVTSHAEAVDLGAELGFDLDSEFSTETSGALSEDAGHETEKAPAANHDADGALAFDIDAESGPDTTRFTELALDELTATSDVVAGGEEIEPIQTPDWGVSDEFVLDELPVLSDTTELNAQWSIESDWDLDVGSSDQATEHPLPARSHDSGEAESFALADLPVLTDDAEIPNEFLFDEVPTLSGGLELVEELPLNTGGSAVESADTLAVEAIATERTPSGIPVWVLGASIGGPQAVKEFVAGLSKDIEATFIVAQHIGNGFVDLLADQLGRVTELDVRAAESGMALRPGQIVVAPVEQRMTFADGVIALHPVARKSVYSPCIDDVMTEVAAAFEGRTHAIIFSGMGNDGVSGARAIVAAGGTVWAQAASTCVISSMADAARDAGVVSESDTPAELARRLLHSLNGESGNEQTNR